MKKVIVFVLITLGLFKGFSQSIDKESVFSENEYLEFNIKYLSFSTSTASLQTAKEILNGKEVYHIIGKGKSSRFLSLFFKIRDQYETIIDANTYLPYRFIRNINEGGYKKDIVIDFDQEAHRAEVNNKKYNSKKTYNIESNVHDMISSFYYLRNIIDATKLKKGDEESLTMFFDEKNYDFKLRFLGRETVRTKYGKKACLKFKPLVVAERVFKEEESLTVWISDDKNKIPVKISADLAVGALTANLTKHSGLKYPFTTN